ncbi:hypothetical protein NDU88_003473 [Pleurodeles waltl]|uniref:Uncharacterized protein n=1 Tax=Pleurodeles waltl TaxID=8319 RepID=A0AAV7SG52_PLEWA|nr:hypothetical protein NDU88_003473 [Pleurodeles waltl]
MTNMADERAQWERTMKEVFKGAVTTNVEQQGATKGTWAATLTLLTKYMACNRVPRVLRILVMPMIGGMVRDLFEEWSTHTEKHSKKMMGTLNTHAKCHMEQQTVRIEELLKEMECIRDKQEGKTQLTKMEEHIAKQEDDIFYIKLTNFFGDKLDYQYGRIFKFAQKYESLRAKEKISTPGQINMVSSNTKVSSDPRSSADEDPNEKLDFHREMRLFRMATPQCGRGRS